MEKFQGHSAWRMALIIITLPVFAVTLVINYLSSQRNSASAALYESSTGNISDMYETYITPASWTFTIWAFIYTWLVAVVVYHHTLLCRRTDLGYMYLAPGHIHFSYHIVFIINALLNLAWIFLFDRQYMEVAFVFLFAIGCTIYAMGVIVCRGLASAGAQMEAHGMRKDIWLTRILVLNGMAFYGTWCTIATLLNLTIVLQYSANVDPVICTWLALGILTAEIITWFVLETFVFDRHLRYCFSQYIVLPVALSGVLYKHYSPDRDYMQYVIFLLALAGALALVKIIVMIVKGIKCPIRYNNVQSSDTELYQKTGGRV